MYRHVLVAGTFDGLHTGHRLLLTRAFEAGESVTIGLTTDTFVRTYKYKFAPMDQLDIIQYSERKKSLEIWLTAQKLYDRATLVPVEDPYEPAASMRDLDALIVTSETKKRGEEINNKRKVRGIERLALIEVPIAAADDGKPVSSTRVRNGEIDEDGRLIMPEAMRDVLGKPLGTVLTGGAIDVSIHRNYRKVIITVGDVATKTILDAGILPCLAIIDGKVGRKPFPEVIDRLQPEKVTPFQAKYVKSGPGYISKKAMQAIREILGKLVKLGKREEQGIHGTRKTIGNRTQRTAWTIVVDGEEDLLALPAIMEAPMGSIVYYGQPPLRPAWVDSHRRLGTDEVAELACEGLVEVSVRPSMRKRAQMLLRQFVE